MKWSWAPTRVRSSVLACTLLVAVWLLGSSPACADIRLPRILSDGVVLQRDKPIHLWGWARAGEMVSVELRDIRSTTRADEAGEWQILLPALAAGPALQITFRGDNVVVIKDVLLGDVWLASGQSNMQFPVQSQQGFGGIEHVKEVVRTAKFPTIRLFQAARETATAAQVDINSPGWLAVRPNTVGNFSAVAYLFGREVQQRYHIPIGLIESTWGGTSIATWMSARALRHFPEFAAPLAREARITPSDYTAYAAYREAVKEWYAVHGNEDRGRGAGQDLWAAEAFDDSHWSSALEPQPWPTLSIPNFDGTVWFRKTLELEADDMTGGAILHLCALLHADITFVNGHAVGATVGENPERSYRVPAEFLHVGRNSVAIRISGAYEGGTGFVGMHGEASDLFLHTSRHTISLAGAWRVESGPNLNSLPKPPLLSEFRAPFPQAPTLIFNAMIAPLQSFTLKGILWYQGESDIYAADRYRQLFPVMIADWRVGWHEQLPFIFVQIAGFGRDAETPQRTARAALRDAQMSGLTLPKVAMATALDLGNRDDIHPKDKSTVAHRLVLAAAHLTYGEPVIASGPEFECQQISAGSVRLRFRKTGTSAALVLLRPTSRDFAIAGESGNYAWGDAAVDGNEIVVKNSAEPHPIAVRYAWSNNPEGVIRNSAGLPAPPFDSMGRNCR